MASTGQADEIEDVFTHKARLLKENPTFVRAAYFVAIDALCSDESTENQGVLSTLVKLADTDILNPSILEAGKERMRMRNKPHLISRHAMNSALQ